MDTMSTITVSCTSCGEVSLKATGCRLTDRRPGNPSLDFFCPACKAYRVRWLNGIQFREIREAGVQVRTLEVPDEATESQAGPPISMTEVLEWTHQLYGSDFNVGWVPQLRHPV